MNLINWVKRSTLFIISSGHSLLTRQPNFWTCVSISELSANSTIFWRWLLLLALILSYYLLILQIITPTLKILTRFCVNWFKLISLSKFNGGLHFSTCFFRLHDSRGLLRYGTLVGSTQVHMWAWKGGKGALRLMNPPCPLKSQTLPHPEN